MQVLLLRTSQVQLQHYALSLVMFLDDMSQRVYQDGLMNDSKASPLSSTAMIVFLIVYRQCSELNTVVLHPCKCAPNQASGTHWKRTCYDAHNQLMGFKYPTMNTTKNDLAMYEKPTGR